MVESPRGELGVYLVSDGGPNPTRCKLRSPAFSNLSALSAVLAGQRLPDAVAIAGMVDVVMGEIDR
jgi:NADH:ubiquinone oxidoreductase subunit D